MNFIGLLHSEVFDSGKERLDSLLEFDQFDNATVFFIKPFEYQLHILFSRVHIHGTQESV